MSDQGLSSRADVSQPWLDEGTDGPRTYALVLGVSAYRHLPGGSGDARSRDATFGLTQLESAAAGAWRFACWLRDHYRRTDAPLGRVWLLLSPSEREARDVPGLETSRAPGADGAGVRAALAAWAAACSSNARNVAMLYVSGHGIMLEKDSGALVLLEDFAAEPLNRLEHALDVASVRDALTVPDVQLTFVDACAVRPTQAGCVGMTAGVRLDRIQERTPKMSMIYASAAPNGRAFGNRGRGSIFADALMECLAGGAAETDTVGSWIVNADKLAAELKNGVARRAGQHRLTQAAMTGGWGIAPIHELPERPAVEVCISVRPEDAAPRCSAELRDYEAHAYSGQLDPPWTLSLPAGIWEVDVAVQPAAPPYSPCRKLLSAMPPGPHSAVVSLVGP